MSKLFLLWHTGYVCPTLVLLGDKVGKTFVAKTSLICIFKFIISIAFLRAMKHLHVKGYIEFYNYNEASLCSLNLTTIE